MLKAHATNQILSKSFVLGFLGLAGNSPQELLVRTTCAKKDWWLPNLSLDALDDDFPTEIVDINALLVQCDAKKACLPWRQVADGIGSSKFVEVTVVTSEGSEVYTVPTTNVRYPTLIELFEAHMKGQDWRATVEKLGVNNNIKAEPTDLEKWQVLLHGTGDWFTFESSLDWVKLQNPKEYCPVQLPALGYVNKVQGMNNPHHVVTTQLLSTGDVRNHKLGITYVYVEFPTKNFRRPMKERLYQKEIPFQKAFQATFGWKQLIEAFETRRVWKLLTANIN